MKAGVSPRLLILCLDDEPAVLDALVRDLAPFENYFQIEAVTTIAEARQQLEAANHEGIPLALALCDHLLKGETGTEFLVDLHKNSAHAEARKVLITAQAGLQDTIRALNQAQLDYYIAKPWEPEALRAVVRDQLTAYVVKNSIDPRPYLAILDRAQLSTAILQKNLMTDA